MSNRLVDHFNDDRQNTLREKLNNSQSLQDVATTIYDELAFYSSVEGAYLESLTPSQAKTALVLLALLRESNDAIGQAVTFKTPIEKEISISKSSAKSRSIAIKDTIVITFVTGVGAYVGWSLGPLGGVIGAALSSGATKMISDLFRQDIPKDQIKPIQCQAELILNTKDLIDELKRLFNRIDKLVLESQSEMLAEPEDHVSQLTDFPEFLGFLQKLAGQSYTTLPRQLEFTLLEEMPSLLRRYDIELCEPTLSVLNNIDSLDPDFFRTYDVEKSPTIEAPVVDAPVVMKNGRVILKGKIRIPVAKVSKL